MGIFHLRELIDNTIEHLSLPDLASISRVSRSLNHIAIPLLYTEMELTLDPMSPSLLALVQQPGNAEFTHNVTVHLRPCDLQSDEMRKATNIIRQMSSLQTLELHYRVGSPILEFMHQIAIASFPQLRSFRLQPEPPQGPSDWKQTDISAVPVFQLSVLPHVKELYLHGVILTSKSTSAEPITSFPTQRLTLKDCQIKAPDLGLLLRHSPKLTSLDCGILIDAEKAREWFDLSILSQELAQFHATLKHLCISFDLATSTAIDTGNDGPWGIRSSLTSLKEFSQLQSLEIGFVTLLGWNTSSSPKISEALPPGLERLTLTREVALWWGYQWDDVFETGTIGSIIQECVQSNPHHLKEIVLHVPETMGSVEIDSSITGAVTLNIIEDEY
ncbi:hypothetical protein FB567DRAFT_589044 [Paraphoma chrysanthemicola]|uniref:F-box domain-containing protein n=1 Tax=Paraphoma chrysanthemicola TaxID=798071 RepID=A0A8K0W117_9PLEO|nr:hypothetical protein FB567DRAFT_589044 [Paraphoma chrysanthemicola]